MKATTVVKRISFLFSILLVITSCGDIGGGGGGGGASDTGIYLNVNSIVPRDAIVGKDTSSIDMTWNQDCSNDGTTTITDIEKFGAHSATVTISATLLQGATSPPAGTKVFITKYKVEFTVSPGYSGPSFPTLEYNTNINVTVGGSSSTTVNLMTEELKKPYVSQLGGTGSWTFGLPVYTVTYTFYGQDDRGRDVSASAFKEVTIGGFNNC